MTSAVFWTFLALTVVVEVPIYTLLLGGFGGVRWRTALLTGIAVNLVSYPMFVFVLVPRAVEIMPASVSVVLCEVAVCLLEALLVRWWLRVDPRLAAAASLLANGWSVLAGLVVALLG